MVIILFNTGSYKSLFSTYLFGKLVVLSFCAFCVYFFCAEFDVIFLNFYNICIIIVYIVGVKCFCSNFFKQFVKTDHIIKIWLQLPIKNMPPESFWV